VTTSGSGDRPPEQKPLLITPDMLARPTEARPADARSPDPRSMPGGRPAPAAPHRATVGSSGFPPQRVDFEKGMTYAPPLTLVLLVSLCAVFVWQVGAGTLASVAAITDAGALVRANVVQGEWWRMITATFLHGGIDHLLGNAVSLYTLGMACEHAFGTRRYAATYAASGLGGSVFSTLLSPGPSVGASGAIFGLMGALIAYLIKHQDRFHVRDKRVGIVLLAWAVFTLALGLTTPFVDNGAHSGGLLTGIVAGLVIEPRPPERRRG
jgi:rhomboid protease GluP